MHAADAAETGGPWNVTDEIPDPDRGPTAESRPAASRPLTSESFRQRRYRKHKGIALALGALGGSLAGWANTVYGLAVVGPLVLVSPDAFLLALVAVVAPIVEENVKLLSLVLLRAEEKATYTPRRWLVLGAFAGAGFGVAEALFYWINISGVVLAAGTMNLALRLVLTVPLHALLVAISAYGYGLALYRRNAWPAVGYVLLAIVLHSAFNTFQTLRGMGVIPP